MKRAFAAAVLSAALCMLAVAMVAMGFANTGRRVVVQTSAIEVTTTSEATTTTTVPVTTTTTAPAPVVTATTLYAQPGHYSVEPHVTCVEGNGKKYTTGGSVCPAIVKPSTSTTLGGGAICTYTSDQIDTRMQTIQANWCWGKMP